MLDNEDFNLFADNPFLTEISHETANADNEKEIMEAQKQKDMETFCKIYAQCSYNNVIRLSYGEKRQAFDAANKALARQGIYGKIDRGLYCAGMSMASFCQAYEIFKKENPESFVGEAVGSIIEKCKISAHSTTGMRDIYKNTPTALSIRKIWNATSRTICATIPILSCKAVSEETPRATSIITAFSRR